MENSPYISQEQQETFERFLMDKMDATERTQFQKQLELDADLAKNFEEFKALFRTIEEEALTNQMNNFHKDLEKKEIVKKPTFNKYRIAASIVIIISLGLWFFNRQSENERLFNQYFSADPGLPTVMGNSGNYDFYEAMVDYKQGNYSIAIEKWEKLLEEKPKNDTLNYFLGMANLAEGNTTKTISFLEQNLKMEKPAFLDDTYYFLGMAHLKNNDLDAAKENFKKSGDPRAKKVFNSLK